MALKLNERYPGRFNNPSAGYPQGSFKNRTSPTAKDGSYLESDWANDKEGFFQSLLSKAVITANGTVDSATSSQYYDALLKIVQVNSGAYIAGGGTANAHTANFIPPVTALTDGMVLKYRASVANTSACTFNPNGLGARPIVGGAHSALQGGEIVATGDVWLQYNSSIGSGSWILIDSTGGALQVAAATQSQHAIQLKQMAAVIGSIRNAGMNVSAASATATFTASEVAVKSALGGAAWLIPNFNKTINLAATGAGGMDTGPAPVSGWVAIYAIYNPTTDTSALLAVNSTSAVAPEVCAGVMPSGYTASALVSVWGTTAGGLLQIGRQQDRDISVALSTVINITSTQPAFTPTNIGSGIPPNAKKVSVLMNSSSSVSTTLSMFASPDGVTDAQQLLSTNTVQSIGAFRDIKIVTQQTIYTRFNAAGTVTLLVNVTQYSF